MKQDVRILLVGEPGVGKTSLILSLVSEEFPEEVPCRAEEITIPADVTPEKVPTHIVDFSCQEQDEQQLLDEITKAHVICVVYAADDEETVQKITSCWLPLVRRTLPEDQRKPVVLVGNKSDLLDTSNMESILPIMNEYAEVETCVECSAKTLKNISEVFYYAQKAVLHPMAPLYQPDEKELTPKCKQALSRVFKICDQDNDGILNDREIYQFQRRCFNVPLQPQALEDVKAVVRKHLSDGVIHDGISQRGFLFLHTLFIQRGRHETTWTVLRKFGYDDNLQLNQDYIWPSLKVPTGCSTELSHQGFNFFASLFEKYDEDKDGCLSPTELQNLFSTCPTMPWGTDVNNTVFTNEQGWITYQGFLAQWMLTTVLDVPRTLEYLAYLGYMYEHDTQVSAIHVTRDRKTDFQSRQTSRTVFQCHVIGPKGVGKTAFLQGHLGRNIKYLATLNKDNLSNFAINTVTVYGQEKYLLLQEIDVGLSDTLRASELSCDVACLLYDITNPRSFEYCARMYTQFFANTTTPVLVVACKGEHKEVVQDHELQPAVFCNQHSLQQPHYFTCLHSINQDVYSKLGTMAAYPAMPELIQLLFGQRLSWLQKLRHMRSIYRTGSNFWMKASIGVAIAASLSYLIYRYVSKNR